MGLFKNFLNEVKKEAIQNAHKPSKSDRAFEALRENSIKGRVQKMADESGKEIKTPLSTFKPRNKK